MSKQWLKLMVTLILLLTTMPLLAACDDDDDEGVTVTVTETATATATSTSTATTAEPTKTTGNSNQDPIKIGGIISWSGPAAMAGMYFADQAIKLIEQQVEDAGGILGGRMVEIVRCDNAGAVAEASACAIKLDLNDHVSAFVWGGTGSAEFAAIANEAEKLQIPYVCFSDFEGVDETEFSVVSSPRAWQLTSRIVEMVTEALKPETVGFLSVEDPMKLMRMEEQSEAFDAAGIETVYSEAVPFGIPDYSPFLTKIKYEDPDVLIVNVDSEQAIIIAKQILELGGWGDIKVVGTSQMISAAREPGAKGWLALTPWNPGGPASQKFEEEFRAVNGNAPTSNHVYFYLSVQTVIEAIKLADSDDPADINEAIHSGNLEFDTPMGMAHFTPDGDSGLKYIFVQIQEGGKTTIFDW